MTEQTVLVPVEQMSKLLRLTFDLIGSSSEEAERIATRLIGANIRNFSRKKIVSLLLYGSKSFKYDVNNAILNATINYIHKTEKFKST